MLCRVVTSALATLCCLCIVVDGALHVLSPYSLRRTYSSSLANFGAPLVTTRAIRGTLIPADPLNGCTPHRNSNAIRGNLVLAERGGCSFAQKALIAQQQGAIGIVISNLRNPDDDLGDHFLMADDGKGSQVRIHAEMISGNDAAGLLRAIQEFGEVVEVSIGHRLSTPMYIL